jgi:WD40 repeat protein
VAHVWDNTGAPLRMLDPVDAPGRLVLRAVAPDGSWIAGTSGNTVFVWDSATGAVRLRSRTNCGDVYGLATGPDGSWLAAACSDWRIRVVDLVTGRNRRVLRGHEHPVVAIVSAPDRSWLASPSSDRTGRLWDANTGQLRRVR